MLIEDILNEGIVASGNELLAYIMVVAEEYHKLPKFDENEMYRWELMVAHNNKVLPHIMSGVKVEFTGDDPYKNQREMMYDMIVNKRMKIYATIDDDDAQEGSHPGISNADNSVFRAVHDFLGHYAPNVKEVTKYIKDNNIKDVDDSKFKSFRFKRNSFTVRGEMGTYVSHSKMSPPKAIPAMFTEIVGQICTYFVTGDFTENKVAVIDGVDFKNVGKFSDHSMERRKQNYQKQLEDDNIKSIDIDVPNARIDKGNIRWGLISHGEGKKRKKVA